MWSLNEYIASSGFISDLLWLLVRDTGDMVTKPCSSLLSSPCFLLHTLRGASALEEYQLWTCLAGLDHSNTKPWPSRHWNCFPGFGLPSYMPERAISYNSKACKSAANVNGMYGMLFLFNFFCLCMLMYLLMNRPLCPFFLSLGNINRPVPWMWTAGQYSCVISVCE